MPGELVALLVTTIEAMSIAAEMRHGNVPAQRSQGMRHANSCIAQLHLNLDKASRCAIFGRNGIL